MNAINELEALAPEDTIITLPDGQSIKLRPLVVRQLAPFARALREIPEDVLAGIIAANVDALAIVECAPHLARAISIATGIDEERLLDWEPDVLLELGVGVVEVNGDFFVRRLTPMLVSVASRLMTALGERSSSASSNLATDAVKS